MQIDIKFKSKTLELLAKAKYQKSISLKNYDLFGSFNSDRAWFDLYTALDTNRKLYKLKHRKLNGTNN